ncbi:WXG100 family type VII secretion target [Georgenia sp. Z1344]|uniref:WXG100 family type VII secretion target n=1 Tax=Georgenia sp. Z1344 TaxID=3416706 RepID=UPI003CF9B5B1
MNTVEAGEGALETAAGRVDETKATVEGEFTRLGGQLQGIGMQWTGAARQAFDRAMVRWDEEARHTNEVLTTLAENLRGTQSSFTAQDEEGTVNFNQLLG